MTIRKSDPADIPKNAEKWLNEIFQGPDQGQTYHVEIYNQTVRDYLEAARLEGEVPEMYLTEIITKSILLRIRRDNRRLKRENR